MILQQHTESPLNKQSFPKLALKQTWGRRGDFSATHTSPPPDSSLTLLFSYFSDTSC